MILVSRWETPDLSPITCTYFSAESVMNESLWGQSHFKCIRMLSVASVKIIIIPVLNPLALLYINSNFNHWRFFIAKLVCNFILYFLPFVDILDNEKPSFDYDSTTFQICLSVYNMSNFTPVPPHQRYCAVAIVHQIRLTYLMFIILIVFSLKGGTLRR